MDRLLRAPELGLDTRRPVRKVPVADAREAAGRAAQGPDVVPVPGLGPPKPAPARAHSVESDRKEPIAVPKIRRMGGLLPKISAVKREGVPGVSPANASWSRQVERQARWRTRPSAPCLRVQVIVACAQSDCPDRVLVLGVPGGGYHLLHEAELPRGQDSERIFVIESEELPNYRKLSHR